MLDIAVDQRVVEGTILHDGPSYKARRPAKLSQAGFFCEIMDRRQEIRGALNWKMAWQQLWSTDKCSKSGVSNKQ